MSDLAPLLQQVGRTEVQFRGRRLLYFSGCDYFRLSSHPTVLRALRQGLDRFGLNVSASRKTTGNHAVYEQLERGLARFFGTESAVLASNGYLASSLVTQVLAGEFTHAWIDERAHACLFDAARFLDGPARTFRHRDPADLDRQLRGAGRGVKPLVLTDGMFSHSGEVAPLPEYLRVLPRGGLLVVDDAHGAGTLGRRGRGTPEFLDVGRPRLVQTITLSKAFGVYGGAVLGSTALREKIVQRSRLFVGNTPLPPPLAHAALAALNLLRKERGLQQRLHAHTARAKSVLRAAGLALADTPSPILPLVPCNAAEAELLRRQLLRAEIYPPLIRYPGGPVGGYFRFVLSSEHTPEQLDRLLGVLLKHLGATVRSSKR